MLLIKYNKTEIIEHNSW